MTPIEHDATQLLIAWDNGDQEALAQLVPLVEKELHRLARLYLSRERPNHTLQPTALVNEAYLKLIDQKNAKWQNRAQFYGVAAQLMRRILVDHARARAADKRGGHATRVSLSNAEEHAAGSVLDVLAIHEALDRLALFDATQARIVELRFFAGLTVEEAAATLDMSPRTIKREWRIARAWLFGQMK